MISDTKIQDSNLNGDATILTTPMVKAKRGRSKIMKDAMVEKEAAVSTTTINDPGTISDQLIISTPVSAKKKRTATRHQ